MIQRYNVHIIPANEAYSEMVEHEKGKWCAVEDVEKLEKEIALFSDRYTRWERSVVKQKEIIDRLTSEVDTLKVYKLEGDVVLGEIIHSNIVENNRLTAENNELRKQLAEHQHEEICVWRYIKDGVYSSRCDTNKWNEGIPESRVCHCGKKILLQYSPSSTESIHLTLTAENDHLKIDNKKGEGA